MLFDCGLLFGHIPFGGSFQASTVVQEEGGIVMCTGSRLNVGSNPSISILRAKQTLSNQSIQSSGVIAVIKTVRTTALLSQDFTCTSHVSQVFAPAHEMLTPIIYAQMTYPT